MKKSLFALMLLLCTAVSACTPDDAAAKRIKVTIRQPDTCWNTGADGWTVICSTAITNGGTCNATGDGTANGTCFTAISNSGNDGTCSSRTTQVAAEASPCLTLKFAGQLVRDGKPDQLLLKKGDTWTITASLNDGFWWHGTTQGFGNGFCVSGASATAPILIGSYGTGARPLLKFSFDAGNPQGVIASPAITGTCHQDYFAIIGLEFYQYKHDPGNVAYDPSQLPAAALFLANTGNVSNWILVEGNKATYFGTSYSLGTTTCSGGGIPCDKLYYNAKVRRNISAWTFANNASGFASGNHFDDYNQLLIEENITYHDGWLNAGDPTNPALVGPRTLFFHSFYIQNTTQKDVALVTSRKNVIISGSWGGLQQRPGGIISENFLETNGVGITVDSGAVTATNNVILQSQGANGYSGAYTPNDPGWGMIFSLDNGGRTQTASNNIIVNAETTVNACGLCLLSTNGTLGGVLLNNIVFHWQTPILDNGVGTTNPIWPATNGNIYEATTTVNPSWGWPAAQQNRNAESYDATLGGPGTIAHFSGLLLAQSKDSWNASLGAAAINSYVRFGFGR